VINFFDATIRAYQQYPTFDMLAAVGIVPSNTTAYPLSDIENALKLQLGVKPYVSCTSNTTLSEIWYLSHVYGTVSVNLLSFLFGSGILMDFRSNMVLTRTWIQPPSRRAVPQSPSGTMRGRRSRSMKSESSFVP